MHAPSRLFSLPVFTLMLASFALGAAGVLLHAQRQPQPEIVCESGSFGDVHDERQPYLKQTAGCNVGNANGPAVEVIVID